MAKRVEQRLKRLREQGCVDCLRNGRHGIEKESLRVTPKGRIALTPHPGSLGSALTHDYITTDYSEALLEFVTPPFTDVSETLANLQDLHAFTARILAADDELLWATSMPCAIGEDAGIPIARYGSSNAGTMRHIYRHGLAHRYGRAMQVISGVHYNFSLPENFWRLFSDSRDPEVLREQRDTYYFGLIRNFQRSGWLIPFLFGASPAVCKSFLQGRSSHFEAFDEHTLFEPWGTSLRMSDIGYKNKNQAGLGISYNDLKSYTDSLERATRTPDPEYERIGVEVDGEWRQLNSNMLQIENEYYSFIRPKQPTRPGERPVHALRRRGVEYIEVRALDVSAFDPLGVHESQLRFVEAFLIYCLLMDSPPLSEQEEREIDVNQQRVACRGRQPGLHLLRDGDNQRLDSWAREILTDMEGICELLDANHGEQAYSEALRAQKAKLDDPDCTPSARMLAEMRERGEGFFDYAMRLSQAHMQHHLKHPLSAESEQRLCTLAEASLAAQRQREADDEVDFHTYLTRYFTATG
ncbi:glutamate--cysteine ligase [Natronospira bacteriovora]|uniref:Glutamate--cysteine ligase n=1 Tax=Natronospira bacteriovora TaxID=3069753 RepID=A0ABU0W4W3_9GAMM|nr:glutamate--cysteine ligase [Natronospira sp. AB-CW4]MDQ2068803.1 glutamate--cysteine ligase [Natronospira sp. AB-CW4]